MRFLLLGSVPVSVVDGTLAEGRGPAYADQDGAGQRGSGAGQRGVWCLRAIRPGPREELGFPSVSL